MGLRYQPTERPVNSNFELVFCFSRARDVRAKIFKTLLALQRSDIANSDPANPERPHL